MQRAINRSRSTESGDDLARRIQAASSGGSALDAATRERLQTGLNTDLSAVRVHTDNEADRLSESVEALAFTTGQDIFFRSGTYDPTSPQGLHLLAHEATHTLQQSAGPVAGTPAPGGVSISDPSDSFEQAAEQAANQVLSGTTSSAPRLAGSTQVQRQAALDEEEEEPLQTRRVNTSTAFIQREEIPEDEEMIQTRRVDAPMPSIQREEILDEEEMVQTYRDGASAAAIQREELAEEEMVQTRRAGTSMMSVQREPLPEEEEPIQTRRDDTASIAIQRDPDKSPEVSPAIRKRRERAKALGAADARQMLSAQLPAVLSILSESQIEQIQRIFDAKVINPGIETEYAKLQEGAHYMEGDPERFSFTIPEKQAKADAVMNDYVPIEERDRWIKLDASKLFDSDVFAPPTVNVADEMAFRDWMYQRIESGGIWLHASEEFQPHGLPTKSALWLSLGPGNDAIPTPNGVLNMKALLDCTPIGAKYYTMVWEGPSRTAVKKVSDRLFAEIQSAQQEHFEASQRRENAWFFVRWETEWFGGADYPSVSIWDDIFELYFQASDLEVKGHIEEAYKAYIEAAQGFEKAANRLYEFENRVQERLGSAVKWLNRAKIAGAIAATIATGGMAAEAGLGIAATGTAMAEGGALYGGFQEGMQQVSEMGHGQRQNLDFTAIGSRMVKEYVFGKVGASIGLRTSHYMAEAFGIGETTGLTRILGGGLTHALGDVIASPVITTMEIATNAITGGEVPEGPGAMLELYLERAKESAIAGGILGTAMSTASAVKAQEMTRVSELITERQTAWLDRVNQSAIKAWNEGGSWQADEAAVRNLTDQAANRLRRGALPDGTRAKLPREELNSMAEKLEHSIDKQIENAKNLTKVVKGPQGVKPAKGNQGAGIGWHQGW